MGRKDHLMRRLSEVRSRAEQAHLSIVVHGHEADKLRAAGLDASESYRRMKAAENAEQKLLKEMTWILDQLDSLEIG
ncbi:hypothetical protein [Taklimakanibacter albus]|jgi:hypothetical protein|uniref:Uncharacterized protein n=1 Tax=Taklimakanibacter albus TaxID=2800327 RepID=A0ACC5R1E4_9HYPH|nr:hypothetical protein [Aestuariivirga sp. YIM B02566]MBK1866422.1 hypothetical protein [Aestuariivirga sp. YIM B02566]